MNKIVFGLIIGGALGIVDGLSSLISAPEVQDQLVGIVIGSTVKGLLAGLIIGWYARRVESVRAGIIFGFVIGLALAALVAAMPDEGGNHYWIEIMLPGSIVGLIVGYATQKYRPRGAA